MKPQQCHSIGSRGDTPLQVPPAEQGAGPAGGRACPGSSVAANAAFATPKKRNEHGLSDFIPTKRQNGTNFGLMIKTAFVLRKSQGQKMERSEQHQTSYIY